MGMDTDVDEVNSNDNYNVYHCGRFLTNSIYGLCMGTILFLNLLI